MHSFDRLATPSMYFNWLLVACFWILRQKDPTKVFQSIQTKRRGGIVTSGNGRERCGIDEKVI